MSWPDFDAATEPVMAALLQRVVDKPGFLAPNGGVFITLFETSDSVNRARGEPRYNAMVNNVYGEPQLSGQHLIVDAAGKHIEYTMAEAVTLAKKIAPGAGRLQITVQDASRLPTKWTDDKKASTRDKVKKIDFLKIRVQAKEKQDMVKDWAGSDKKEAMLDSAAHMLQLARKVQILVEKIKAEEEAAAKPKA